MRSVVNTAKLFALNLAIMVWFGKRILSAAAGATKWKYERDPTKEIGRGRRRYRAQKSF